MLKRFTELSEIEDEEHKEKYSDFHHLNRVIERENVTKEELREEYEKVMMKEYGDIPTELNFQIRYLLDEVCVAVDSILKFYDFKYTTHLRDCIYLINNMPFGVPDGIKTHLIKFIEKDTTLRNIELYVGTENDIATYIPINKDTMTIEEIHRNVKVWYNECILTYSKCEENPERGFVIGFS